MPLACPVPPPLPLLPLLPGPSMYDCVLTLLDSAPLLECCEDAPPPLLLLLLLLLCVLLLCVDAGNAVCCSWLMAVLVLYAWMGMLLLLPYGYADSSQAVLV